ncbi:hypothetical protein ACFCXH_01775 [Streptomyces nojiriensis]|uniref:hypothetical protein n=1 Tax=Streptomyces nojiriensis TaxID=66374 RepID=UPI0035DFB011
MSGGEVSGVDLARVALRAAMEAARKNGTGQKAKEKPQATTTVRRDGLPAPQPQLYWPA